MSRETSPLTLRLPFAMSDHHLRLQQVLARDRSRSWSDCLPLVQAFALSRPEKRFACRLLTGKRNMWLYRCNQRGFCGDFIAVDMSAVQPAQRTAVVLELKSRCRLSFGGSGAGMQFSRVGAALEELRLATGVITVDTTVTLACGSGEAVLDWLGAIPRPE